MSATVEPTPVPPEAGRLVENMLLLARAGVQEPVPTEAVPVLEALGAAVRQWANVGALVAGLFVVNTPFLVVVALFVWLAAAGEALILNILEVAAPQATCH